MQQHEVQQKVRELITETDQLSRFAHETEDDRAAEVLASLRSTLMRIDRWLGSRTRRARVLGELDLVYQRIKDAAARALPEHRAEIEPLLETAETLRTRMRERGHASRPLFGVLPLARLVPINVHAMADYAVAVAAAATVLVRGSVVGRLTGAALGASGALVALTTDYEMSLVKAIPIEAHEAIDYLWSLGAIAAPFAFGYWRKAPLLSAIQIACGVGTIAVSLVTDYRSARGVGTGVEVPKLTLEHLDAQAVTGI